MWEQYGLFIVIGVALILTAAVSFETFRAWSNKRNQEVSNAYTVAVALQNQGRYDESLDILKNLAESNRGIYSDIAKLQIANIYIEQGKTAEALEILAFLANNNKSNRQMRDVAAIKLASYKLDSDAPAEEITGLLEPLTDEDNSWSNVAHELLAMLYIREGNIEEARAEYEAVLNSSNVQDALKARAQDMLTLLSEQSK